MTRHRKRTIMIAGAAAAAVLLWSVFARGRAPRPDPSAESARPVSVALARQTPLQTTLTLSGEFKPFQEVDLHAKVAGYIKTISVDVGDRVKVGQVLAVLEIPELVAQLQEADAALDRSRSAHDAAHSAYARLKEVSETRPGLIAAQELEDAFARDKQAEAQMAQASATLRQVTAMSDYTRITAPFSGVIVKRYADTGALIQAGTSSNTQAMPVVRLAEDDRLRLVLPVPESAVSRIHVGTTVRVRVPALDRSLEGRVARLSDDLDRQTRTMETEIDVANPDASLVAGMYAETVLVLSRKEASLTVPIQAVSRNGAEATVLVVSPQDRVESRTVKIGLEGSRRLEILGGLADGDRVVIGGRGQLRAGDAVKPQPIEEAKAGAEAF
ncbi:MAG TPA: efflux RND transporter periplasmic adaptor subunit [Thermoanaerobaculia bacterium]|nr:efflux RND transporter periplasmic adaptor subunit [Thermoanaerobaculia bacterium]